LFLIKKLFRYIVQIIFLDGKSGNFTGLSAGPVPGKPEISSEG